jgi:hypothetical protein
VGCADRTAVEHRVGGARQRDPEISAALVRWLGQCRRAGSGSQVFRPDDAGTLHAVDHDEQGGSIMNVMSLIAIVIVLMAVAAVAYALQRQRSRRLRTHFGPEYDHAVEGFGQRRAAERALLDRARRVDKLELRPLLAPRRDELWTRWQAVQAQFVDDPEAAIREAHSLLSTVMREQGYPTSRFEEQVELLSVHHPATVQHYREAHRLADERARGQTTTEQLRQAMIHYRALFEDLLNLGVMRQSPRKEVRHEA